jgi:hypothetical protein
MRTPSNSGQDQNPGLSGVVGATPPRVSLGAPPGIRLLGHSSYCDRELAASRSANAAMVLV